MKSNNLKTKTAFPDDENQPTPQEIFNKIVRAAEDLWCPMDPVPIMFQRLGHIKAWGGERSLLATLCFEPISESNSGNIGFKTTVADNVREITENFRDMMDHANGTYKKSKVIFDKHLRCIVVESNGDPPIFKEEIRTVVQSLFKDFSNLLNDDSLRAAIEISNARFLGTPLDIWDEE